MSPIWIFPARLGIEKKKKREKRGGDEGRPVRTCDRRAGHCERYSVGQGPGEKEKKKKRRKSSGDREHSLVYEVHVPVKLREREKKNKERRRTSGRARD